MLYNMYLKCIPASLQIILYHFICNSPYNLQFIIIECTSVSYNLRIPCYYFALSSLSQSSFTEIKKWEKNLLNFSSIYHFFCFLFFLVSIWYYFLSAWGTSFNITWNTEVLLWILLAYIWKCLYLTFIFEGHF